MNTKELVLELQLFIMANREYQDHLIRTYGPQARKTEEFQQSDNMMRDAKNAIKNLRGQAPRSPIEIEERFAREGHGPKKLTPYEKRVLKMGGK